MSNRERLNREFRGRAQQDAVAVANAILLGTLGIIEGARRLSSLAHDLGADWTADTDFLVFGALNTETDHLPVGKVRELWDPSALAEKDAIVLRIEAEARADVERACRNVLARFAITDVPSRANG